MREKYVLIDVHGNEVICNCTYSNLDMAKEDLNAEFRGVSNNNNLEHGKDCWIADDKMSAWAILNGKDRVWTIIKVPR